MGFGTHAGELIAPDEGSGAILAISAGGQSTILVASGIAHGGDIGVESGAFIPPGFSPGGTAYIADRGTPNNPHPGTDTILRMTSAEMKWQVGDRVEFRSRIDGGKRHPEIVSHR